MNTKKNIAMNTPTMTETTVYQLQDEEGWAMWLKEHRQPTAEEEEMAIIKFFRPRPDLTKEDVASGYDPHSDNDI